jgi:uncharacterized HAD superfamily protein
LTVQKLQSRLRSLTSIYVDFDDVLCETARALVALLQSHFGRTVAFDDVISFDLAVSFGLNAAEYAHFMHLAHQPEVLRSLRPVNGAAEALHEMKAMGYEIAVVTGRPARTAAVSEAWLRANDIPYHSLTFVDKYGRGMAEDGFMHPITLDQLTRMRFAYAVEDSGDMAAFLAGRMAQPVALLDRPWNKGHKFDDVASTELVDRCASWAEILSRLRQRAVQGP